MRCPFCAEEIQDAAVLCRFCGARKRGEDWESPPVQTVVAEPSRKGSLTLKSTGVLLIASAFVEAFSLTGEVPLFGAMRGGVVAVVYHSLYVVVFLSMGVALLHARAWGYRVVLGGCLFYVLGKLIYLVDSGAREAELANQASRFSQVFQLIDVESVNRLVSLVTLGLVACWAGLALYVRLRRDDFR